MIDPLKKEFELLIEQNKGIIYKLARAYCKDIDEQKDLMQEIIIQLWRSYHTFNNSVKITTWMYKVAFNVSISYYRKYSKRKEKLSPLTDGLVDILNDETPSVTEEKLVQLHQFISELKDLDKALMLLYLEEKSYKEISDVLGISESNISTKVNRIKQKLREKFSLTD
jgi:RNA polymerase sigma factor (sigma-70 family)